jgi:serine/threonine protein phosphatase 1
MRRTPACVVLIFVIKMMKRTFVVGDIHGCYAELMLLLAQAGVTGEDVLISVGDLVDRGNRSKEVWQFFKERPHSVVVMGNHERKHLHGILNYAQEIVRLQMGDDYPAFLQWIDKLPYYYETEHAIVVHAAMEHDVPLSMQREDVLSGTTAGERYLQGRYERWTAHYTGSKPVIYGHTVVGQTPQVLNNTWGIDTGACHAGHLTMIELPGFVVHQVKVQEDHWAAAQEQWQIAVLQHKDWEQMELPEISRQLDKLAYKTAPEIRAYLSEKARWLQELEQSLPVLKTQLEALTARLVATHGKDFGEAAVQYKCRSLLFKCRGGRLQLDDLKKTLNTPAKINELRRTFAT